ncbi:MAG TPA: malto-oligosyltrehalose trehalohydrolase [Steroidobacteraceae bacterium]|nr:malto-oligosyltrehalose trehalohydrolase [Steroidobacteraceae bacterium]
MIATVWAPSAKTVELVTPQRRIALHRANANADSARPADTARGAEGVGYWQGEIDASLVQDGYRYSIDGGAAVPDPRSMWQPDGVHGPSRRVDLSRLRTAEPRAPQFEAKPLCDAVIYELHVGTFTPDGTYAGAQAKLPHLVQLGVTHIELMPLATFPGRRGWGYDGVDLYAPFPAYGTPQELASFIDACHAEGLGVLLDVVYNHLGPDGNHLAQYGPYFTDRYKTGWGEAINYDGPYSDGVRRFVIDNALMWLRDYGFDGLRLDAVHAIFSFDAVHVLEELAICVRQLGESLGRNFVLIAESDLNDPRLVRSSAQGGFGLDAHWADDFHHAVHRFFTGETDGYYADFGGLQDVASALRDGYVYQGQYSPYRRRRHGRAPTGIAAHQLVVSSQNHDQIGNRAQGERLSMLLAEPQLKAIAALTLLSPFVPLLFQGEEWAASTPFLYFTDHENTELGRLVAEGRSREFSGFRWQGEVPNPQELETFTRSKLEWSELAEWPHAEMLGWYRQLIRLRHTNNNRARSKAAVKTDPQAGWLRFMHGDLLCVFNFAATAQRVPMPGGEWELELWSTMKEGKPPREAPPQATLIYRRRPAAASAD